MLALTAGARYLGVRPTNCLTQFKRLKVQECRVAFASLPPVMAAGNPVLWLAHVQKQTDKEIT